MYDTQRFGYHNAWQAQLMLGAKQLTSVADPLLFNSLTPAHGKSTDLFSSCPTFNAPISVTPVYSAVHYLWDIDIRTLWPRHYHSFQVIVFC